MVVDKRGDWVVGGGDGGDEMMVSLRNRIWRAESKSVLLR